MKRRLMIARALVHSPELLILDEPTAGVDIELRHGMWNFLRDLNQEGVTIILTTHYLEEAETLCTGMAIIDKGLIIKRGPIKTLLAEMEDESVMIDLDRPLKGDTLVAYTPVLHDTTIDVTISREHPLDTALRLLQAE